MKAQTAQANQIRGLLAEFGIVLSHRICTITRRITNILEAGENGLTQTMRQLLARLTDHLKEIDK